MKNTKITLLALAAIAILSCTSPTKDFDIHISPTFYKYVIEVELFDIIDQDATFTDKPTIEIGGVDAAGIYNIDGTKNFEINFGSLQLIVERNLEPSALDPIDFVVTFTSNTYQQVTLPISIGEQDYFKKFDVGMLNPNNLPTGITNSNKSGAVGTNGQLAQPIVITAGSNDSLSKVVLTVPNDITFQDANGNPVTGSQLDVNILSLSDTSDAGQQALPNGGGIIQQVLVNGVLTNQILTPSSTFKVDMSMGGSAIKQFSGNGIGMKVDVPSIMFNNAANRAYQAGDSISLLSNSDGATSWESDGNYLVQADGQGGLYVDANVNHLSYKKLVELGVPTVKRTITVNAKLPSGTNHSVSGDIQIKTFMSVPSSLGRLLIGRKKFPVTLNTTLQNILTVEIDFPATSNDQVIFSAEVGPKGTIKDPLFTFNYSYNMDNTTITATPSGTGVSVSFSLYCEGDATVINPPAGVKMFYKPNADPTAVFQHLYTFTQANIGISTGRIYQLDDDVSYDFRALFGDEQIDTNNVLVEDGKHYQVILPQAACNELF